MDNANQDIFIIAAYFKSASVLQQKVYCQAITGISREKMLTRMRSIDQDFLKYVIVEDGREVFTSATLKCISLNSNCQYLRFQNAFK